MKNIISTILIIAGLFLAICTADGSAHEIAARIIGIAATVAGVIIGGYARKEEA